MEARRRTIGERIAARFVTTWRRTSAGERIVEVRVGSEFYTAGLRQHSLPITRRLRRELAALIDENLTDAQRAMEAVHEVLRDHKRASEAGSVLDELCEELGI